MPIVSRTGFAPLTAVTFHPAHDLPRTGDLAVDVANDTDVDALAAQFERIDLIRIPFSNAADGRGFSVAKRLRHLGFQGRIRARGHLVSDQFRYALACGFDEIEIDDALAERQPEAHWVDGLTTAGTYRDKLARRPDAPHYQVPEGVFAARVTQVRHYTSKLFQFRISRPASFRFRSGEFVMIGLPNSAKPVYRAYSIASPSWDDELEFYSIKVPDGPLTRHLQRIVPGDTVLMRMKATGTLVLDALTPGRRLYLFSTGTGMAPFASIIRDQELYDRFDEVVLTQTCRTGPELAYGTQVVESARTDPLVGELAHRQLRHYTTTTRDSRPNAGRITTLIQNGKLFCDLGLPELDPTIDRAMICGSIAMVGDMRALLEKAGFVEGSNSRPATMVVERAFVD